MDRGGNNGLQIKDIREACMRKEKLASRRIAIQKLQRPSVQQLALVAYAARFQDISQEK